MKKITIIIGSLERGGAEIHLSNVLPKLSDSFSIELFLLEGRGELIEEVRSQGVNVVMPWCNFGSRYKIVKLLKLLLNLVYLFIYLIKKRPTLIHFFLPQSYLLAGPLAFLLRVPKKIMSRRSMNNYQEKYPKFVRKIECWLHTKMTFLLGNSQKVVEQLINEEGVPREKARLVYNGLPVKPFSYRNLRQELNIAQDHMVMVIVANLIPYKGHVDLIQALGMLETQVQWDLLIVGKDSANIRSSLEKLVQSQHLTEKIQFLGSRTDIANILENSDIGLLVSHQEGFSNAILEGMAHELPMIVTDVGGNSEAILNEECGLIVPPHDPLALSNAIKRLLEDEALRNKFAKNAKERFENNFTLSHCVNAYRELYSEILES